MPSVFLCHSSVDKPFVRRLARRLEHEGVIVWLDEACMEVGDSLIERIGDALDRADYVIAALSAGSINSPWVQKELRLALTREITGRRTIVLPVLLDPCEPPNFLADKLYVDFSVPGSFGVGLRRLLRAMGLKGAYSVDWTDEGPMISGKGVTISPPEANALLDRWSKWLPKFTKQEGKRRGRGSPAAIEAALLLSVLRACVETYNRTPGDEEMQEGETELSRKYDLFFNFAMDLNVEAQEKASHKR